MPFSHHSHSGQFCRHASGTLEEVVLEAIRLGFEVYGLTEHVPRYRPEDLYPEEAGLSPDALIKQFSDFLDEAHKLKAAYTSQITLLVGLETEFITNNDLENLSTLLSEHPGRIEYIVGSIHHVNAIPIDFDHTSFKMALRSCSPTEVPVAEMNATAQCRMDNFLSNYLDAHYRLLERFRPEIIGHLDLCRLYNPNLRFSEFPNAWSKLKRNVEFAIGYNALFEVNAAALRKGWQTPYPGEDVAALILELGGRLALSDDSHGPHRVGENYSRVRDYLRQLGVKELWYLTRTPDGSPFERGLSATCVTDDWWKHDFWDRCTPSGQT
ncbi:Polymerase/histidinol phosphatase-like protein [Boletus edulis BED1]|uniref:Histidinol-phosphatase n=1 Tax=Boletus edulis BED1 TaxID=1328754 RepID=A0AAD4C8E6_BOLED|nr:Polymerase/histidinol phosphatase-like protein [Boletus edulis BED1]